MATVSVRYIIDDVDAAVAFYVERLGFDVEMQAGPRGLIRGASPTGARAGTR